MSSTVRLRERVRRGSTPPRDPVSPQAPLRQRHQVRCQDCSPARRSACRRFLRNQPARRRVFHSPALRPSALRRRFRPPALRPMFHRQGPRSALSGRSRCPAPTCFESCSIRCRCRRRHLHRHRCRRRRGHVPDRCPGHRRLTPGPPRSPDPGRRRRPDVAAPPAGSRPRHPARRRDPVPGRSRARPAWSCRRGAGAPPSAPVPASPRHRSRCRLLRAISGPG